MCEGVLVDTINKWIRTKTFSNGVSVTFTMRQSIVSSDYSFKLNPTNSSKNFKYFKNILNGKIFGNSYKRYGKELRMLVVLENSVNNRLHYHTIIEKPDRLNVSQFDNLIRECWNKTLFGYSYIDIQHPSSISEEEGWVNYIMKRKTKEDFSTSIDLENSSCLYLC